MEWPISWEDVKKELEALKTGGGNMVGEEVWGDSIYSVVRNALLSSNHTASASITQVTGTDGRTYTPAEIAALCLNADRVRMEAGMRGVWLEAPVSGKVIQLGDLTQLGFNAALDFSGALVSVVAHLYFNSDSINIRVAATPIAI